MLPVLIPISLAGLVIYQVCSIIYNLFFHPLAKYPGPKLWVAFPVLRHICNMRGNFDHKLLELHEKYGEILRFSPNEVTFTTAEGWRDIYGHGSSLPKHLIQEKGVTPDIITSNGPDHSRFRRALSHAFSERGLRMQEPLITGYVDHLINALGEECDAGKAVDMTMWYNLTTFDIISDLAFGKAFHCLEYRGYHEYIVAIFDFIQAIPFLRARTDFPLLWELTIGLFYNHKLRQKRSTLRQLSKKTALMRAHDPEMAGRGDFMDSMTKNRGEKASLTEAEIASNANILFIAGSETTATLLSGVTYWLLRTPHALQRVATEVRDAFVAEKDIDFVNSTQRLPYMLACLEEALRLYPPVPGVLLRQTLGNHEVGGHVLPPKTRVGVHQLSSYHTERNFHRAKEFVPERWLSEATQDPASPFYNDKREVHQPFSFGPRNCIGRNLAFNEMRIILARVLWNFDLSMREESQDWQNQKTAPLWVKHSLWCDLKHRK